MKQHFSNSLLVGIGDVSNVIEIKYDMKLLVYKAGFAEHKLQKINIHEVQLYIMIGFSPRMNDVSVQYSGLLGIISLRMMVSPVTLFGYC